MTSDARIQLLLQKGVQIPNPETIQIGRDVDIQRISGDGVVLHGGCKLFGKRTTLGPETVLGYEGPVTLENCWTGRKVTLAAGFFKDSVFLANARMGSGAHVREGCLMEEYASGAHTVGLKQTILFPYVTLGSLINFCDCLMTGGTDRKNHSEVGSSYIHFNFTPNQDKATPSLLGDVAQGVMLRQPPIFLGGQGGLVGPARLAFGTVVAAGTICRQDELRPGRLIFGGADRRGNTRFTPGMHLNLKRIVMNNIIYMGNLLALRQWYVQVRQLFTGSDFSEVLHQGAVEVLDSALEERVRRFTDFIRRLAPSAGNSVSSDGTDSLPQSMFLQQQLQARSSQISECIIHCRGLEGDQARRDSFLKSITVGIQACGKHYLDVVSRLDDGTIASGTLWLQGIIDEMVAQVQAIIPDLGT